jgi:glycosyltransferase involved in cell wall biosynthesis
MTPKFTVCIPNYNYEKYLGRTIQSILDQTGESLEILVSDNASTDGSAAVVRGFNDSRIQLHVNACNVGFSGNLDRSARGASGALMIMLSSDDLIRPGALAAYRTLFNHLGPAANGVIASSTFDVIDPHDRVTGGLGPNPKLWTEADRRP